jgi:hypothetical protein
MAFGPDLALRVVGTGCYFPGIGAADVRSWNLRSMQCWSLTRNGVINSHHNSSILHCFINQLSVPNNHLFAVLIACCNFKEPHYVYTLCLCCLYFTQWIVTRSVHNLKHLTLLVRTNYVLCEAGNKSLVG